MITREYYCVICDEGRPHQPMDTAAFKEHLRTVHGIEKMEGTRQAITFLDGKDYYQQHYSLKIGSVTAAMIVTGRKE